MMRADRQFGKTLWLGLAMTLCCALSISAWADDEDLSEAEVTIIQDDKDQRVEEYRINGKLYMIRVIPVVGPIYVMLDHDGDGQFEFTNNDPTVNPSTSQWILFKWN